MSTEILARQRRAMQQHNLDAIVVIAPENVCWTAGITVPSQKIVRHRHAIVLVPAQGEPEMVVVNIEEGFVRANAPIATVTAYNEFTHKAVGVLAERIAARGLAQGRIGVESGYLNHTDYLRLVAALPRATLVPVDELIEELRMLKTPGEIAKLTHSGRIAEQTAWEGLQRWWPGMTELDLAKVLTDKFAALGGDQLTMLAVTAGERTPMLNGVPSSRPIRFGDVVRIDVIGTVGNYYCDVARTAVVGPPSAELAALWQKLVDCRDMALELIRPGVSAQSVYKQYIAKMDAWGLQTLHFLGHGLGLTLHEEPYVNRYKDLPLQEGMVLAIEPLLLKPDLGMQLEEAVIVTRDGCSVITNQYDDSKLWEMQPS